MKVVTAIIFTTNGNEKPIYISNKWAHLGKIELKLSNYTYFCFDNTHVVFTSSQKHWASAWNTLGSELFKHRG